MKASGLPQIAAKELPLYSVILREDIFQQSSSRPLKKTMLHPEWKQYVQVFLCWTTAVNPEMRGMHSHVAEAGITSSCVCETNIWLDDSGDVAQTCHSPHPSVDYSWAAYCKRVYTCAGSVTDTHSSVKHTAAQRQNLSVGVTGSSLDLLKNSILSPYSLVSRVQNQLAETEGTNPVYLAP